MAKRKVTLELDDDLVLEAQHFAADGDVRTYLVEAIAEKVAGDRRYENVMADLAQRAIDDPIDPAIRREAERQVEETLRRLDA
jgi:hypothetical protein